MMTRYWRWERAIRSLLPEVLASGMVQIVFQPIFDIRGPAPLQVAFEGLARFPSAPTIPAGLWFKVAKNSGLGSELELLAARRVFEEAAQLEGDATVFVNISPEVLPLLLYEVPQHPGFRVVFDMPVRTVGDERWAWVVKTLRSKRIGLAVDAMPPREPLARLRENGPDFVRVDTVDDENLIERLADAAEWCSTTGSRLIAHRVERVTDLTVLKAHGADWAQGYGLA